MNWGDSAGVSYLGWTWNPWACTRPALITSWDGQPSVYGQALREHLHRLHLEGGPGSPP
jgi:endoglucanase